MEGSSEVPGTTIGVDVGDRHTHVCVLDQRGEVVEEARIRTTEAALKGCFERLQPARVVLEVGPHSPWISRLVAEVGHEVIVANPRKLRLIYENDQKCDRADAEYLARVGRMDPNLLAPVIHRGERAQADLGRGTVAERVGRGAHGSDQPHALYGEGHGWSSAEVFD